MKGTYILVISVERGTCFKPGSLPRVRLPPGCYVYVGSAMGPGGFEKRVFRHLRKRKKARWHIDYLTRLRTVEVKSIIYAPLRHGESRLAHMLPSLGFVKVVKGFGATDSPSDFSHLLSSNEGARKTVERIACGLRRSGIRFRIFNPEALISPS